MLRQDKFKDLFDTTCYFFKLAGRIKIENHYKIIAEIVKDTIDFLKNNDSRWRENKEKLPKIYSIGNLNFEIILNFDTNAPYIAAAHTPLIENRLPSVIIYVYALPPHSSIKFYDQLNDVLIHELTHLIDISYQPNLHQNFTKNDTLNFFKEFKNELKNGNFNIGKNIFSLSQEQIEKYGGLYKIIHKIYLSLLKDKNFISLMEFRKQTIDKIFQQKIKRIINDCFTENTMFQMYYPEFGLSKEFQEKEKQYREYGKKIYFNSILEVKAYLNQIIMEINYNFGSQYKLYSDVVLGKEKIGNVINNLLESSETWKENNKNFTDKTKQVIYKEVGRFLIDLISRKSPIEIMQNKLNIILTPNQKLQYKYLMKLYNSNQDDKLEKLLLLPEYEIASKFFNEYLNTVNKINSLQKELS